MTQQESFTTTELQAKTVEALQATVSALAAAVQTSSGTRAALIAISYALAKQSAIDKRQLYEDAKFAIEQSHNQDEMIPASATEFLAQLHDALK